jgi:hypothetical protein
MLTEMQGMAEQVESEMQGAYKPVWDAILDLELRYPETAELQHRLLARETSSIIVVLARLLNLLQPADDGAASDNLDAEGIAEVMSKMDRVVGFRAAMLAIVISHYGMTVLVVEHLYTANRLLTLEAMKDVQDREEFCREAVDISKALYPQDRVNAIREMSATIWSTVNNDF